MTSQWRLLRLSMVVTTITATLVASFVLTYTWSIHKKQDRSIRPPSEAVVPADNIGLTPQKTLLR